MTARQDLAVKARAGIRFGSHHKASPWLSQRDQARQTSTDNRIAAESEQEPDLDAADEPRAAIHVQNLTCGAALRHVLTPAHTLGAVMNTNTRKLHNLGQRIWIDNISREMLDSGTLARYVAEFSVTGLTSNPTIFEQAIASGESYDESIVRLAATGLSCEDIFFKLALHDLTRAADLFRPMFDASENRDGWVSLEVSPLLASDKFGTVTAAAELHARAGRPNLFIKIPGTPEGISAIEQAIFEGVPVNVTLLFSSEQYSAAAEAYMRGIERRIEAGLSATIESVASVFISRWDVAVNSDAPAHLANQLGIAMAARCYKAHGDLLASPRWQRLARAGARPQRLLWASTGVKDPAARDTLYVESLAAAETINTLPEKTLLALADHGQVGAAMPADGLDGEQVLTEFASAGVDTRLLAARLQEEGVQSFAKSWSGLMARIQQKRSASMTTATPEGKA